ncbi:hypothetical protein LCGC14_0453860 [marine sediment metagenome]|uniref:Uncharacterized protein n=1 Tax=marine sediment metagenome TaxID=412755 RepID=A0A0F9V3R1_9ZZZZ
MSKKTDLSNLYDGSLVKVTVRGNKSKGTFVENYAIIMSASFFDTDTRREFQRLKKEIQRLPYQYSPPKDNYQKFLEINRMPWVSNKELTNLVKELTKKKQYLENDFVDNVWDEKIKSVDGINPITQLYDERKNISLTNLKTKENIVKPEQQSIPLTKEEFRSWFEATWEIIPITKGDSFISEIIRSSQKHLKKIQQQIDQKQKDLTKKENLAKDERERIETDLKKLRTKKENLNERVNKQWKDGIDSKQDQYIALIDTKISDQLQEFYLLVERALHDFSYKGKVHGRELNTIKNKANQINQLSDSLGIDKLKDLSEKLLQFPDTIKSAQIKLSEDSGILPDLDLFDVDFSAITKDLSSDLGKKSTTTLELEGLSELSSSFNSLFSEKAKEPKPEKKTKKKAKPKVKKTDEKSEVKPSEESGTFVDVAEQIKLEEEDQETGTIQESEPSTGKSEEVLDLSNVQIGEIKTEKNKKR